MKIKRLIKRPLKQKLRKNDVIHHSIVSNILDAYKLLSGYYISNYKLNCVFLIISKNLCVYLGLKAEVWLRFLDAQDAHPRLESRGFRKAS